MSLANDLYTLLGKGTKYSLRKDVLKELPIAMHDIVLGAKPQPKDNRYVYTDLHAHLHETTSMRDLIDVVAPRTDILAIVTRTREINTEHLTFERAVQKLEEEKIEHQKLGKRVAVVKSGNTPFYLVRGTKIYSAENQGIILVGNNREYDGHTLLFDTIMEQTKDSDAFWYLDHPFSIYVPKIVFRYPTDEEMKQRDQWFEKHHPVLETGNYQNTLYMFPSNKLAEREANKHGLVGIANSETHFNMQELGLSRTGFPKELLTATSEDAFFRSLNKAYSVENKDRITVESHYADVWSFLRYMVLPALLKMIKHK